MSKQTDIIQNILNKKNPIPHYRFAFGSYQGRLLEYVVKADRKYLLWLLSEDFIKESLRTKLKIALKATEETCK